MYLAPVQPPRQRLPPRVYAARRVGAGIAAVAVLFLMYTVVSAVFGATEPRNTGCANRPQHLADRKRRRSTDHAGVDVDNDH